MTTKISPQDQAKMLAKQREMSQTTINKKDQSILKDKTKDFVQLEKVEFYDDNDDYDCVVSTEEFVKKSAEELQRERESVIKE